MKKRKLRRSVAVSSAASRKGWRVRKKMKAQKIYEINFQDVIQSALEAARKWKPTIDRLPKVEWK